MKLAQSHVASTENTLMDLSTSWNGIRGIVFDAVGTLIEPVPSVAETYTAAARRQGVVLDPKEVRARFHVHFRTDGVHAQRGSLSTDEETERRRWRMIVSGVLPEVTQPERAFDELWDHFSQPASWRCFPDVAAALDALCRTGDGRLRRLKLRRPVARSRERSPRAERPRRIAGDFVGSRLSQATSIIFSSGLCPPRIAARSRPLRR